MDEELDELYDQIVSHLDPESDEKCVLLLGPELSVSSEGEDFRSHFNKLAEKNKRKYYPKENLFSRSTKIRTYVKQFYQDSGDPVLMQMISKVKFPLILNVCPDTMLVDHENMLHGQCEYGYFNFKKEEKPEEMLKPTGDRPIVYNLFGSVRYEQSIIITHGDLYKAIEKILTSDALPESIRLYLKDATSFIFLGFKFESWHYHLVCHKLQVRTSDEDDRPKLSTTKEEEFNGIIRDHFRVSFTPENPTQAIDRIIQKCANQNPNLLRERQDVKNQNLFISYKRGNGKKEIDWSSIKYLIQDKIKVDEDSPLNVIADDQNTYGSSIDSFMTRIGLGKAVIIIISDDYFKSDFCMTEALRIWEHKDPKKRVFIVKWDNLDDDPIQSYTEYWDKEVKKIVNEMVGLDTKIANDKMNRLNSLMKFYMRSAKIVESFLDVVHFEVSQDDFEITDEEVILKASKEEAFQGFLNVVTQKMEENA